MENEKWGWFGAGLLLGLLLGLGIAGGYGWYRMEAGQMEALRAREEAVMQAEMAREAEMRARESAAQAIQERARALQALEQQEKDKKDK